VDTIENEGVVDHRVLLDEHLDALLGSYTTHVGADVV